MAMTKSLSLLVVVGAVAISASTASAATITIDGHFKETTTRKSGTTTCFHGESGGGGMLRDYGKACELFTFESFDGFDAFGCPVITGTDTITLDDPERSSFTEREHDGGDPFAHNHCTPGQSHEAPGHLVSYGNPGNNFGTWSLIPGTGTGIFAGACAGSGNVSFVVAGAAAVFDYSGDVMLC
jgi:hypothetical protein